MKATTDKIVLFEDQSALTLEPLTLSRPTWDLRCGILSLKDKILSRFVNAEVRYYCRAHLAASIPGYVNADHSLGPDTLWINGSLLPGDGFDLVSDLREGQAFTRADRMIAFRGESPAGREAGTPLQLPGFQCSEAPPDVGRLFSYLWELVIAMNAEIEREARKTANLGQIKGEVHPRAILNEAEKISIAEGCQIRPGAVLDARNGVIVLDQQVVIGSNAVIEGPVYFGPGTEVKPLAHIRGCSFGEQCRAGGEISVTIMQGFSNKQHSGFLGHSYIGSWCNLGSGTENSNLKNNYSPIRVQVGNRLVDTGELFVGLIMGDHSKSAIGTVFNTGTVVGVAAMIFGAGFPPRYIPSFHWGGAEKLTPYHLKPTLETARIVMARRHRQLTDADTKILTWIFTHRLS
ncbi:MAG: putative sugar nucleotidyl transferase [bacterium]|nr:putative sugar nucleotidyl transferase [bacterium]